MRNCVRNATLLASVFVLALTGAAFAGANADVTFSSGSQQEVSGVAAGQTVALSINGAGLADVRQVSITLQFDPADAVDLAATAAAAPDRDSPGISLPAGFIVPGPGAIDGNKITYGGANFFAGATGDAELALLNIVTAGSFNEQTELTISVVAISIGPSSSDRDAFAADALAGLTVTVNPPAPAPTVASIDPAEGSITGGTEVTIAGTNFQDGATVTIGGSAAATSAVSATSITATVPAGAEGAVDVVVSNPDAQSATLAGGFTYLGVIEPTLTAGSAVDVSLDYSAIGDGQSADGSVGEVTFTVNFTDATGSAAADQAISWEITNNGSESVFLVAPAVLEIAAGATETVDATTGADGSASGTFDAEGDKSAGTATINVSASTSAANSEGADRSLNVAFSATWDVPVAAELASFAGSVIADDEVLLQWAVASQSNNLGWEVYRSTDQVVFERVGDLVSGDGTSEVFKSYNFIDGDLPVSDAVFYYLKQIDLDGTTSRSNMIEVLIAPTAVAAPIIPNVTSLNQNYPNPFNPETTISFDLSERSVVTLTIYDAATGQLVRKLVEGESATAGIYQRTWDGRDNNGLKVASGVYIYQLKAGKYTAKKKMTLLQ
mgnify:CR=1 FL=1